MSQSVSSGLRQRILAFVGALVLLSLMGSTFSLYRITEVNRSLDAINRVSVPLGRLLVQMQADSDVYRREVDRRLGFSHWNDPHWRPKAVPRWIEDVLDSQVARAQELVKRDLPWSTDDGRERWRNWISEFSRDFSRLRDQSSRLYLALEQKDEAQASKLYPELSTGLEEWSRQLQWGVNEYERGLRQGFARAESRVAELRTGLEGVVVVVVSLSLLLLWLGERALRPLGELTKLAREITRRGLKKEDKAKLPEIALGRNDEVSQLAREFHHMATVLLEREKVVETQKSRLEEQNRLLRDIGALNRNILNSIESALLVTDLEGRVTQCNPVAAELLGVPAEKVIGSVLASWEKLGAFENAGVEPLVIDGRSYGSRLMTLQSEKGEPQGAILALEDLTEELALEDRVRRAENLAAVGRLSAQVAHEVRNPLHSIGLEAELAADQAAKLGDVNLKSSLQSILASVDRLEKITDNYLKLSRLSAGEKSRVDLGEVLEAVLATYAQTCESQGVTIDWSREGAAALEVWGDRDLLEQCFGNLLKNALQALEGAPAGERRVAWRLGVAESGRVWARIEDTGPGILPEVLPKLFTPFVTSKAQGTGLGLSFVKKVIEDHGGTIELHARERGACFDLLFPPGAERSVVVAPRGENLLNA